MAASGLDPAAESRPSLYQAAHSGNITPLAETGLAVRQAVHETHRFIFPALADAARVPGHLAQVRPAARPGGLRGRARRRARGAPARPARHGDIRRHLPGRRAEAGHAPVSGHYVKRYASAPARNRAEANYRWLTRLQGPAHLPELRYSGERELRFQHVEGRHALPADLTMLAAHLGDVHGSVHAAELRKAELPRPYSAAGGQVLPAFPAGRLAAVERELAAGHVPGARLTISQARRLIAERRRASRPSTRTPTPATSSSPRTAPRSPSTSTT